MNRNTGILIILIIAVLIVVAIAAVMMSAPSTEVAAAPSLQTLMVIDNNAPHDWVKSVALIENITNKAGSPTTIFIKTWMKPDGRSILNLSQELGYGKEALPAGTTFRMKVCSEPYSINKTGQTKLNITINGGDLKNIDNGATAYDIVSEAALRKLPATITNGTLEITSNPSEGSSFIQEIDGRNFVCVEVLVTVNADGTVTITPLVQPVLCNLIAGG